jgi:hypothetical protein
MRARLEWLCPDGQAALFTLTEPGLDEDDEYAFYVLGALVIARREEGVWKGVAGGEV